MKKHLLFKRLIMGIYTVLLSAGILHATNYYVDPATGDMSNDGSLGSPWSKLDTVFSSGKTFAVGDTIFLKSGNHGFPVVTQSNAGDVVITKYDTDNPIINRIDFSGASHWVLDNVEVTTSDNPPEPPTLVHPVPAKINNSLIRVKDGATHITFTNCFIYSIEDNSSWTGDDWNWKAWNGMYVNSGSHYITIENCHVKNVNFAIHLNENSEHNILRYTTIENFCGDGLRISEYGIFEYNVIKDAIGSNPGQHYDLIQGFRIANGAVIRGNMLINQTSDRSFPASCQGIGLFDGMYYDIVIENNLIVTNHWNGLSLYGAVNCKIVNNTVVKSPYGGGNPPWIGVYNHKDNTPSSGNIVKNNISATPPSSLVGSVDSNNIITENYEAHFVDYENLDFHLKALSSAINNASETDAPSTDLDQVTRTLPYDIGCYEFINNSSDNIAPSAPTGLDTLEVQLSSAILTWNAVADNEGVLGYRVYNNGKNPVVTLDTTIDITGLSPLTTYTFTVTAVDSAGNESAPSAEIEVTTPETGTVYSSVSWQNFAMGEQTGVFTVTFDAMPLSDAGGMDAVVGILNGSASGYSDLACIARFKDNAIDARNGANYSADATINYTLYQNYHFRMVIDVSNHEYSVFVTPEGNAEKVLAKEFAFRTDQSDVASLNGWAIVHINGLIQVSDLIFTPGGTIDKDAPSAPKNLTASNVTATSVSLSWSASTDNDAVTNYKIYVTNNAETFNSTTTNTTQIITGLKPNTEYTFKVTAFDPSLNESDMSSPETATTLISNIVTFSSVTEQIKVYPNPVKASEYLIIELNNSTDKEIVIRINDIIGKTVYKQAYHAVNQTIEIGTNKFEKGIYIVSVQSENSIQKKKIILE